MNALKAQVDGCPGCVCADHLAVRTTPQRLTPAAPHRFTCPDALVSFVQGTGCACKEALNAFEHQASHCAEITTASACGHDGAAASASSSGVSVGGIVGIAIAALALGVLALATLALVARRRAHTLPRNQTPSNWSQIAQLADLNTDHMPPQ